MEQICDKYGKALKITRFFMYANNEEMPFKVNLQQFESRLSGK